MILLGLFSYGLFACIGGIPVGWFSLGVLFAAFPRSHFCLPSRGFVGLMVVLWMGGLVCEIFLRWFNGVDGLAMNVLHNILIVLGLVSVWFLYDCLARGRKPILSQPVFFIYCIHVCFVGYLTHVGSVIIGRVLPAYWCDLLVYLMTFLGASLLSVLTFRFLRRYLPTLTSILAGGRIS